MGQGADDLDQQWARETADKGGSTVANERAQSIGDATAEKIPHVTQEPQRALVVAPDYKPTVNESREALELYLDIQKMLDEKMPDAIMTIGKKVFRKKTYWRAISKFFNLRTEIVSVEPVAVSTVGTEDRYADWGYVAIVRAIAPNGCASDGDGSCMASEKAVYQWRDGNRTDEIDEEKTKQNASVHNVRSHAVTRAKNRAISDLVGFGEVSADELPPGTSHYDPHDRAETRQPASRNQPRGKEASEAQGKMLHAKAAARASELLDGAITVGLQPKIQDEKTLTSAIKELAALRVGCGAKALAKEVDPLIAAIAHAHFDASGVLVQ